jgi:hypothetical protein
VHVSVLSIHKLCDSKKKEINKLTNQHYKHNLLIHKSGVSLKFSSIISEGELQDHLSFANFNNLFSTNERIK